MIVFFLSLILLPTIGALSQPLGYSSPSVNQVIYKDSAIPTIDGTINANEYEIHVFLNIIDLDVYFEHNGSFIFVGLKRASTGYLAIGWRLGSPMMDGSNIVLLAFDSVGVARDDFATGHSHSSDTSIGGTNDIAVFDVTESGGTTQGEFAFPLTTTDSKDVNIVIGQIYGFIFSYSSGDSLDTIHNGRTTMSNVEFSSESKPTSSSTTTTDMSGTTTTTDMSGTTTTTDMSGTTTTTTTTGTNAVPGFSLVILIIAFVIVAVTTVKKGKREV
ncbi:MAG: DOMON domain-containing protein [Candidatus Hodarchaeales archaeon]